MKTVMSPPFLERVGLHRVALLTRSALRTCFRPGSRVSAPCCLISPRSSMGAPFPHCLPVCSLGVVPRVLCILLVVGTQSRSIVWSSVVCGWPRFGVGGSRSLVDHVTRAPWAWMTMWYLLPFGTRKLDVPNSSRRSRACENADVAFV